MRCSFEKLYSYLSNELDADRKYEVITHLHECDICLEAVSLMAQDQSIKHRTLRSLEADPRCQRAGAMERKATRLKPMARRSHW